MYEAISRKKDAHKAKCKNSTKENKKRRSVGIVLRKIRKGEKSRRIKQRKGLKQ